MQFCSGERGQDIDNVPCGPQPTIKTTVKMNNGNSVQAGRDASLVLLPLPLLLSQDDQRTVLSA